MTRLNVKLVIALAVGTIVFLGGGFVAHGWQVGNTAEEMLLEGQRLHKEGLKLKSDAKTDPGKKSQAYATLKQAADHLEFHCSLNRDNPEPGDEAAIIWSEMVDVASDAKEQSYAVQKALQRGETSVRDFGDLPHREVRLMLVKFYTNIYGAFRQAEEHLEPLLKATPDDAELKLYLARCQLSLAKDREAEKTLVDVIKKDPHQIDAYLLLAALQQDRLRKPAQADKTMDDLVAANSESFRAYIARAGYHMDNEARLPQVRQDADKAMELAPQEVAVIETAVQVLAKEASARQTEPPAEELDRLYGLVTQELEKNKLDERLYRALWRITSLQRKPEEALTALETGSKTLPESKMLLVLLTDHYFNANQIDETTRSKVKELKSGKNVPQEVARFMQARLDMADRKWDDAIKGLEEVRPMMRSNGVQIDLLLASLYMIVNQPLKALDACDRVVNVDDKMIPALVLRARALRALGRPDESLRILEGVKQGLGLEKFAKIQEAATLYTDVLGERMRSLPADQQDWSKIDEVLNAGKEGATVRNILQQAQTLIRQNRLAEARQFVDQALVVDAKNPALWAQKIQLMAVETDNGPQRALALCQEKSQELRGPLSLRVLLISLVSLDADKEKVATELAALSNGVDSMTPAEQERMYRDLGEAFARINKLDEALASWRNARKVQPSDSTILLRMFEVTRTSVDDAKMQQVLEEMRTRFGRESEQVLAAESARIITLVDARQAPREQLAVAQQKLEALSRQNSRSGVWARLQGDIARLESDLPKAIDYMRLARERGERDPVMTAQLAHLLISQGQEEEAKQLLEQLKASGYSDLAQKLQYVKDASKGDFGQLLPLLEQAVERDPTDVERRLDLALIQQQAGLLPDAETTLRETVKLVPANERGWVALVALLQRTGKAAEAAQTLDAARAAVPDDKKLLTVAMCREKLEDAPQATKDFEAAYAARPDDAAVMKAYAAFELQLAQDDAANAAAHRAKAVELLDKMMAQPATDRAAKTQVAWARTQKARVLALAGTFRDFQEGIKLLDANDAAGVATTADQMLKATMYASRQELVFQRQGVKLFEQLRNAELLNPMGKLALAQLYERVGNWTSARAAVTQLIDEEPKNPVYLALMIQMLIRHGEVAQCPSYLNKLKAIDPKAPVTLVQEGRILIASGKKAEGVAMIKGVIPRPLGGELGALLAVAKLFEELGQLDDAEELYQEYYAARPTALLEFAGFLARHGKIDQSLDLCEHAMSRGFEAARVVHVANAALREAKTPPSAAQCQRVDAWITQGLRSDDANAVALRLMRAELLDLQGKYDETEKTYREVLATPGITLKEQAVVGNNLAFLLAMRHKDSGNTKALDEAYQLIGRAIDVIGPSADLLDTRGMVQLARKNAKEAVKDLEDSVGEEPNGPKQFHLAWAQLAAGNRERATSVFQKANDDYGLSAADLSPLERKDYERLRSELGVQ